LAALLRLAAAIPFAVGWFDEIWQYLEPGWHLVAGPWVETWDFRAGIRSWLIPELLAAPMALGHALAPKSTLHLFFARLALAALSLVIVGAATALGLRLSRLHGLFAGLVAASWFELVFFAPRALSEPIGLALLMGAVWLLLARKAPGPRDFAWAGLLMGLCFVVRIQYAPALLTLAVLTARTEWRRAWLPLVAGGLAALAIDAGANLAMGAVPFRWMWAAARVNLVEGRARAYGVLPVTGYATLIAGTWQLAVVPVLLLAWAGAKRYPVLLWIALVHLGFHSLIAHKEYRFVLASTALLAILAAIGTAELLRRVPRRRLVLASGAAAMLWIGGSAAIAAGPFRPFWSLEADLADALERAGRPPGTCGLALYRPRDTVAGAYVLYRRATPIHVVRSPAEAARHAAAFDVVVAPRAHAGELPAAYRLEHCARPGVSDAPGCVLRRTGGCTPDKTLPEINAMLRDSGN
jgi:GPI mannosyltransferase 3